MVLYTWTHFFFRVSWCLSAKPRTRTKLERVDVQESSITGAATRASEGANVKVCGGGGGKTRPECAPASSSSHLRHSDCFSPVEARNGPQTRGFIVMFVPASPAPAWDGKQQSFSFLHCRVHAGIQHWGFWSLLIPNLQYLHETITFLIPSD